MLSLGNGSCTNQKELGSLWVKQGSSRYLLCWFTVQQVMKVQPWASMLEPIPVFQVQRQSRILLVQLLNHCDLNKQAAEAF